MLCVSLVLNINFLIWVLVFLNVYWYKGLDYIYSDFE